MGANVTPPLGMLLLKTLESVLEVAILAGGGYVLTKKKALPRDAQKVISELNMSLFTPCLIGSKIASSLTPDQLGDLWLPPIAFLVISVSSYWIAKGLARLLRLPSKQERFVIGCAIFQNSNSLPLALVSALAYSLDGLYWDQLPNDTDEAVASRGILYLLIFSQLGLAIRWSWGFNYLFAKSLPGDRTENPSEVDPESREGSIRGERRALLADDDGDDTRINTSNYPHHDNVESHRNRSDTAGTLLDPQSDVTYVGNEDDNDDLTQFPAMSGASKSKAQSVGEQVLSLPVRLIKGLWGAMNAPLWAMLISLIIACIPALQEFFFTKGTFVYNSLTTAVVTAGNCAVPLILVVLGGNLAQERDESMEVLPQSKKTVWTAIAARMLLTPLILLPLIALLARFAPVSVVDDPIFLVVVFILVGSPTAIQVAAMCQLNDVFEVEIASICWYSYAVLTIPSTLILVVLALKTVKLNSLGPWTVAPGDTLAAPDIFTHAGLR